MLKTLRRILLNRGMPVREVRRLIGELRDHRTELLADEMNGGLCLREARVKAHERLGNAEHIATTALTCFARRSFAGRHRVLFYAVLPLFVTISTFALVITPSVLLEKTSVFHLLAPTCDRILLYIVPALLAALYYRDAWLRALPTFWRILPAALNSLFGLFLVLTITPSQRGWQIALGLHGHLNLPLGLAPAMTTFLIARKLRHRRGQAREHPQRTNA